MVITFVTTIPARIPLESTKATLPESERRKTQPACRRTRFHTGPASRSVMCPGSSTESRTLRSVPFIGMRKRCTAPWRSGTFRETRKEHDSGYEKNGKHAGDAHTADAGRGRAQTGFQENELNIGQTSMIFRTVPTPLLIEQGCAPTACAVSLSEWARIT